MKTLLIAGSAWGDHHINLLLKYCLPSLLYSLPALLKERRVVLSIRTNKAKFIRRAKIIRRLIDLGVEIVYPTLDLSLGPDKYILLGILQTLDIRDAQIMDADYHLLMPDFIYCENFWPNILNVVRRGNKIITRLVMSTRMEELLPEMKLYRRGDGMLKIPSADLTALGLKHLHARSRNWLITHKDISTQMPDTHVAMWEGKDEIIMISPHQTILYLDQEIIKTISPKLYLPLDSELHKIIPESYRIYCPGADDEITLIEASPINTPSENSRYAPLPRFCNRFWEATGNRNARAAEMFSMDALNRQLLPDSRYQAYYFIQEKLGKVVKALKDSK